MAKRKRPCASAPDPNFEGVGRGANRAGPGGTPARGRARKWTDARIRCELQELLTTWSGPYFPTGPQLAALGRSDLRWALEQYGGLGRWAREMQMPLGPRQDRSPYGLPEAKSDAVEVIERVGVLPGFDRLKKLGKVRLGSYLQNHAASREQFLRDIGFTEDDARRLTDLRGLPRPSTWTPERIRAELGPLLEGLEEWPPDTYFIAAGARGLLAAVRRRGGKTHWAREFGLRYDGSTGEAAADS
jgi:hypothetical protein